jgi:multidrug efflux pump subunit AcrA (membrane-fusion protein)
MARHSRRGTTARVLTAVGAATAVVLVAGGVTAYAATRQSAPTYRTATVSTQPVDQVLQETGTIEPSASALVSFPVSGTVASVLVAMGDRVKTGQKMAALDTTTLRDTVASASSTVANAKLTLYQAETGQAATSSTGSGSTSSSRSGSAGSSSSQGSGSTSSAKAVAAAQQRLLGSVRQVDAMLARTKADLATAATLCASGGSPSPSPSGSPSPSPSGSPSPSPSATPSASPSGGGHGGGGGGGGGGGKPTTCAAAQQLVLADETQVQQIQQAVSKQESALDRLIAGSSGGSSRSGSGSTSSASSAGSGTGTVSAAQLAADQAAVDAAVAQLALAEQNLVQATIVSPIDGMVSSVGLTAGAQAAAGSSSSAIGVINPDGHAVTLSVDVTKIPEVRVGDAATVVPDGSTAALPAVVSYVAVAPGSSGSSAYSVQLSFTGQPTGLRDGIQAAVTLVTAQAAGSLSVPTSAVYHLGSLTYVLVMTGSTTTRQFVTVGGVGALYTQVTKGLSAGQLVVLADVSAAIPTTTTSSRFARFAAGVGAGAGGLGGTGLTGGGTGLTGGGTGVGGAGAARAGG